jgi:hypothetical protein
LRLYVDVDETLLLHDGCCDATEYIHSFEKVMWDDTFRHSLIRNYPLIDSIIKWQRGSSSREVVVWSGGGAEWASLAANTLFKGAIPIAFTGSKRVLFPILTSADWSIDNREQKDRWYLKPFGKVFSPQGFIDYADTKDFQKNK